MPSIMMMPSWSIRNQANVFEGVRNIQTNRTLQHSKKRFEIRRITGIGNLWITEYIIFYDDKPSYTVSIMELKDGKVVRETQYFGDPFEPGEWPAGVAERIDS
jgi:hypothetical protein